VAEDPAVDCGADALFSDMNVYLADEREIEVVGCFAENY
jgi:hypothetical protein